MRVDPDTGRETYGNIDAPPIPIERSTIGAFGFAATVSNEIESSARRIGKTLTRGNFDTAMALARRRPGAALVHHSDRGSQYTAMAYQAVLAQRGVAASMSRAGDCYDNALAESFLATLKTELIDRRP